MEDLLPTWSDIDAIICDQRYVDVAICGELARLARPALKPDGVLVLMTAPDKIADVLAVMTPHLPYRWTVPYLMDGRERSQNWSAKMNSSWKPLLIFGHVRHFGVDVVQATATDKGTSQMGGRVWRG